MSTVDLSTNICALIFICYQYRNSGQLSIKVLSITLPHMSIGARVIRAVALQQIDYAPHGKASAQRHDESLQGSNGRSKKLHKSSISPGGKAPAMKKAAISGGS